MGKKSCVFIILVVFVGIVFFAGGAYAWEYKHLKLEPSFKAGEEYDSNIFLSRDKEQHDWITLLTPGLRGEYGFGPEGKHKAVADYTCELGIFGMNHSQNYGNHDVYSGIELDFEKYTLDVNNRFQFTSSRAGTEFEHRVLRKIDTLNAVAGFHYNKFDNEIGYKFYIVDFLSDSLQTLNYYTNSITDTAYVQIAPKTKGLAEFTYENIQYPDTSQRNGNSYRAMVGVKGDITAKLTGVAKVGYKFKNYNSSIQKDYSNAAAHAALLYAYNDRTNFGFFYEREPYESVTPNNNYYLGDHFIFDVNYKFAKNFLARFNTYLFSNMYPSPEPGESRKRWDQEWAAGPRIEYYWKEYVVAGVGYKFHQRASNIGIHRYDQHLVDMDVKVKF